MTELTVKELLEIALDEQVEQSYGAHPEVVGFADVKAGYRPLYPVTVYLLSVDDTSGIIGLLYPSGEFVPTLPPKKSTPYWEFTETLKYEKVPNRFPNPANDEVFRVVGNSWTEGEVLWDGCAAEIEPYVDMVTEVEVKAIQKGSGTVFVKSLTAKVAPHVRQQPDINSLTGDWATYGAGTREGGNRTAGVVHQNQSAWSDREWGEAA